MRISYRWLARHVDLTGIEPQQLVAELTMSTAEVESLEPFLAHMADVTVGFVQRRDKHPDADKLSVCTVDVGREVLQIVCGANNVAAGQKVAVATAGTVLPGDFKIKRSKIRGVESMGMICSERELGLGDEHAGIWVLPGDVEVGTSVAQALDFTDWVFEIDNKSITHRPDLWGHRGMAAEVAAIFERPLEPLELATLATGSGFPVRIESSACSRYLAASIDGAQPSASPLWLKRLLLAVGQRPIDLLVDLSNFVMLDLGQPNHLFDRKKLSPEGIVVRNARQAERMQTLDGVERALEPSDLLICNGDTPVALAGIMGGEGSKVGADTSALVLEVASFHPGTVRRTSSRLGLRTDALARFEKNLDPSWPMLAARHFVRLLQAEQPQVRVSAPVTDVGTWKDTSRTIELRGARVRKLLGADLDDAAIAAILRRLRFEVGLRGDVLVVGVPSDRGTKDITIEQDLVEEVGRIHRYGNVPERALVGELVPPPRDDVWQRRVLVRRIEDRLALAAHFHQQISYSFVADALLAKVGMGELEHVSVVNPVAEGISRVRRSVVPSLLGLLEHNRRGRAELRLFEIGKGYAPREHHEPRELHELALVLCGPKLAKPRFDEGALPRLQGVVGDLVRALGLEACAWTKCETALPSWANPGACLEAAFGEALAGHVAALEPGVARALGLAGELESDTAVACLSIDALLAAPPRAKTYAPIPQFPGRKVDVALALPEAVRHGDAETAIEKAGKGLVAEIELFDLYRGPNVGPGKKSLAWHLVLQANDRTLADDDVAKFLARVERAASELGGELRRQ